MIDEVTYEEIKAAKEDGLNSIDISSEFNLSLEETNRLLGSKDFYAYKGIEVPKDKGGKSIEKMIPMKKGYFQSILTKKYNQNDILNNTQSSLSNNIKSLWDIIKFLELRKQELEKQIDFMERYILKGTRIIDESIEQ